ncbi:MAG: hypothetical protein QM669_12475 [Siphonobacter sp.]
MVLQLVRRAQLNISDYDACVRASSEGTIYGLSWWLDIVSPDWDTVVWKDGNQYKAVLPIPIRKRYGIRFVHQPLFCQFLAIYSADPLSETNQKAFLNFVLKQYRFVASFQLAGEPFLQDGPTLKITKFCTYTLSLERPYASISAGYNRDRKMNLKRSGKVAWQRVKGTEIQTLGTIFRAEHENQIVGGADQSAYELLEELFKATEQRHCSELWYAELDGLRQAGTWLVTWKNRCIYLFNAATQVGRNGNARTYLLDQYFRQMAGQAIVFDFESPAIDDIAGFYASFGGKAEPYYEIRSNRLPRWINWLWKLRNRLRNLSK